MVAVSLQDVAVLCEALSGSGHLSLNLSYNDITDVGVATLAEHLKVHCKCSYFIPSLHENGLNIEHLQDSNCTLRSVNLAYNDFGPEGAEALSSALQVKGKNIY